MVLAKFGRRRRACMIKMLSYRNHEQNTYIWLCNIQKENWIYKIKIWIGSFEAKDLNTIETLVELNISINILNVDINKDSIGIDNFIENSIYAHRLDINPASDSKKIDQRKLLPKKLDSNPNPQIIFDLKTFYKSEFIMS